ncbi:putative ankyrin repeat-containing domain, PGG domain, ankyrin repeat-containing domain superfamily [Helianthus debilis subsp. tardiflorus]
MMSSVDMELQNEDGYTAFCIAVISGKVGMAEIMIEKNRALLTICGSKNRMPLYLAALHGKSKMTHFLYDQSDRMMGNSWTYDNMNAVFLQCIQAGIFDIALRILEDNIKLPHDKQHVCDVLQALAQNPGAFPNNSRNTISQIRSGLVSFGKLVTGVSLMESDATPLLRLLWKRIMDENPKDVIDKILRGPVLKVYNVETYPSQVLFIAAKMNNTQFLVELIREYPDLIWKTNDDGQTIFHTAVAHRHHQIYSLLYLIGSTKDLITPVIDQQGNNILHMVGKTPEKDAYKGWVAPPFRMFSEFLWYKEVKGMLPPQYRDVKNEAGKSPQELFTENHEKLVSEGMKSINESINISMVVAALICTISFSVVFQIPGGFDQNTGFPMFLHNIHFNQFVLLDIGSFILATTSIFIFLFIILSGQHQDMQILFLLWVAGQLALLESVMCTFVAFIISFFILYGKSGWVYMLNAGAYPLVIIYGGVCIYIVFGTMRGTLLTGYLFRPKNNALYRKN